MRVKRVKQVKKTAKTSLGKNLNKTLEFLKKQAREFEKRVKAEKREPQTIGQMLAELKAIVKAFKQGIRVADFLEFSDPERVERASKQLRVYFLSSFRKGVFNFVVKSSHIYAPKTPEAYKVRLQFKEADTLALTTDMNHKEILEISKIGIECSCDDFKYRFRYWITQMNALPEKGIKEFRFPKITNKYGEHKFLCKHCILVLYAVEKPSFRDGVFKRYIDNIRKKGKARVRVTAKDVKRTYQASHHIKIKTKDEK